MKQIIIKKRAYTPTIPPTAVTTRISKYNKKYVYINLCYRMKNIDSKDDYWYCALEQIINTDSILLPDIIDMLCRKYNIIYLAGIKKGEKVTKKHIIQINAKWTLFTNIN